MNRSPSQMHPSASNTTNLPDRSGNDMSPQRRKREVMFDATRRRINSSGQSCSIQGDVLDRGGPDTSFTQSGAGLQPLPHFARRRRGRSAGQPKPKQRALCFVLSSVSVEIVRYPFYGGIPIAKSPLSRVSESRVCCSFAHVIFCTVAGPEI